MMTPITNINKLKAATVKLSVVSIKNEKPAPIAGNIGNLPTFNGTLNCPWIWGFLYLKTINDKLTTINTNNAPKSVREATNFKSCNSINIIVTSPTQINAMYGVRLFFDILRNTNGREPFSAIPNIILEYAKNRTKTVLPVANNAITDINSEPNGPIVTPATWVNGDAETASSLQGTTLIDTKETRV